MEKRKLCQWLSRLSVDERMLFVEFLSSPLHSHRPQLAGMLVAMEEPLFAVKGGSLSNESYWELIYPGKKYNSNLLTRLLSEMFGELKGFLAFLQYKKNAAAGHLNFLKECREREWNDVLGKEIEVARKKIDGAIIKDDVYYLNKLELGVEKIHFDTLNLGKNPGLIFQDGVDQLLTFFVLRLLKFRMYIKTHDLQHDTQHDIKYEDLLLKGFEEIGLPDSKMVELYWLAVRIQAKPHPPEIFEQYVEKLIEVLDALPPGTFNYTPIKRIEFEDLLIIGINYCIGEINRGNFSLGDNYVKLSEVGLNRGFLLQAGEITGAGFVNIIGIMVKIGNHQRVEQFIEQYGPLIKSDERALSLDFVRATSLFHQKDYSKAKKYFYKVKNQMSTATHASLNYNTRQLLCRILYEEGDWEAFNYELNAFQSFARRNKYYSGARHLSYKNFARFAKKLERIIHDSPGKKNQKLIELKEEIASQKVVLSRSWLLNMINQEIGLP